MRVTTLCAAYGAHVKQSIRVPVPQGLHVGY
jgi:hypothetical protein